MRFLATISTFVIMIGLGIISSHPASANVWIPDNEFLGYYDSNGVYTVIGAVKNTEDKPIVPSITINVKDNDKEISETYALSIVNAGKDIPFKINMLGVESKNAILEKPQVSFVTSGHDALSIDVIYDRTLIKHPDGHTSGFILNKIGSKKHEDLCRQALSSLNIPIIGVIPRSPDFIMESRHLGLIPVSEQRHLQSKISNIAKTMSHFIDIDKIIQIGKKVPAFGSIPKENKPKQKTTIAVALDESFNFYYQDNLDALKKEGAKIEFFSPVSDLKVPDCDGIYIGGGFPEVIGSALEKNTRMQKNIKTLAESEMPIYAECGGLMYLTRSIDYGSKKFKMVGLFDVTTKMQKKLKLNYTKASIVSDCLVAKASSTIQGHEFHFSEIDSVPKDSKFAYDLSIGVGIKNQKDGLMQYDTLASYMHVHFARPGIARNFVQNCIKHSRR